MKEVEIPEVAKIQALDAEVEYTYVNFLNEFVYPDARWRDEWADSFVVIADKFKKPVPGDKIQLGDTEQERLTKIVKSADIAKHAVVTLMPYVHSLTRAKHIGEKQKKVA